MKNILTAPVRKPKFTPILSCFAICILMTASATSAEPNFTGKWKLNTELSKLNTQMSMAPKTLNIQHTANNLTLEKSLDFMGQESAITEKHTLDGQECTNTWLQDSQSTSIALWNEAKLSLWIYSAVSAQGISITSSEAFFRDEAGHLVIIFNIDFGEMGSLEETYVLDKQ